MIKIDEKYFITADANQYVLKKNFIGKDKDGNNKESESVLGYYSSVPSCLQGYIRIAEREKVADNSIQTIKELIKFHNDCKEIVKRLLEEVTE